MRVRRGLGRRRALRWLQRCRPEARASALLASSPARYAALAAALASGAPAACACTAAWGGGGRCAGCSAVAPRRGRPSCWPLLAPVALLWLRRWPSGTLARCACAAALGGGWRYAGCCGAAPRRGRPSCWPLLAPASLRLRRHTRSCDRFSAAQRGTTHRARAAQATLHDTRAAHLSRALPPSPLPRSRSAAAPAPSFGSEPTASLPQGSLARVRRPPSRWARWRTKTCSGGVRIFKLPLPERNRAIWLACIAASTTYCHPPTTLMPRIWTR